jgi:MinD-like ATPase involved in chromosome partitioning or flagellar assembly
LIPDIALAASAREWPDRLHRFLLDHGGGRIVDRVMAHDQALSSSYDVLLIDDICSFLTPRLVALLKQSGVEVVGVYVPEDGPDAKRRLLECGISDVIETEAAPEEFIEKIASTIAHRVIPDAANPATTSVLSIGVTGASEGVGITETSVALARSLAGSTPTVLVDMDPVWPSVAQRLDLPVHPNIRTALDHALHRVDRLSDAVHVVDELMVVGGRADGGRGPAISRADVMTLVDALAALGDVLVADLGPVPSVEVGVIREFDSIILVGTGDPVGVARMIRTANELLDVGPEQSMLAVINKVPSSGYRQAESMSEVSRALPALPVFTLPFDKRVEEAAWDGLLSRRGSFAKSVRSMSDVVVRSLA